MKKRRKRRKKVTKTDATTGQTVTEEVDVEDDELIDRENSETHASPQADPR